MSERKEAVTLPCLIKAWEVCEPEIYHWLLNKLGNTEQATDALHDVFLKALSQGVAFCDIDDPRAWLFRVTRNHLVDSHRKTKTFIELDKIPEDEFIHESKTEHSGVDDLTQCLPRVLKELNADDSDIIRSCDVEGMLLQQYADANNLTLSATKSRIQRARKRLREQMIQKCQVKFDSAGSVCCFVPRKNK